MGASGWHYITEYSDDFQLALDRLRQHVFRSGKYSLPDFLPVRKQANDFAFVFPSDFAEVYLHSYQTYLLEFWKEKSADLGWDKDNDDLDDTLREAKKLLGYANRNAKRITRENAEQLIKSYKSVKEGISSFRDANLEMILIESVFSYDEDQKSNKHTKPKTIDEALDWALESGTHSILDVSTISTSPQDDCIALVKSGDLIDIFGTDRPTLHNVKRNLSKLLNTCARNQGCLVVVYKRNTPSKLLFAGVSGD